MTLIWAIISLVLFSIIGIQESFAEERTWYVGEGLKQGDFFSYKLCHADYNDCSEFQINFWIEGDVQRGSETNWLTQTVVYDNNKIVKGVMHLGKVASEPTYSSHEIAFYKSAFKASITELAAFTSIPHPGSLTLDDYWNKDMKFTTMGYTPTLGITENEKITVPAGTFDAVILSYSNSQDRIWIVDDFPFPIKAETWEHKEESKTKRYQFELLNYKEDVSENPFIPIYVPSPQESFGIQSGYADENLREKLEDSKDVLDYTNGALSLDSYLTKNYVRGDLEYLNKVISNCGKTGIAATLGEYRKTSIFYGRVLEITDSTNPFEKIITLDVEKKWYGDIPNPVQIVTDIEECGNAFELDKKFLVFTVGDEPLFAPFYYVTPPPGLVPEGPHSSSYNVENAIGYIERVYIDTGRLDRLNQLKPQIDHAYNVIKSWEKENNATTSFGMWFVADDMSGLVKLDKGQMALVVSMGVNSSIAKEDLFQLLRDMLGDIPIHLAGQTFFVREGAESESSQIPPPLKQIKNGILPEDVICNEGLWLAVKARDNSPICIKSENVNKFFERNFITKFFKEGKSTYSTPKISPELQEIMDSGVERVDIRIGLKNTPKPPVNFLQMSDEEQVANLEERYAEIRNMQQDLVDYITNNDGTIIKQLEFINSVYADVPVALIDELKNRGDIFTINYYDKDAKAISMPIHPPG